MMVLLTGLAGSAWAQQAQTYVVKRGDTLFRIAQNHGTTVETLQRLNDLQGTTIRVGQRLIVGYQEVPEEPSVEAPADTTEAEEAPPAPDTTAAGDTAVVEVVVRTNTHTARPGDTFYSIAQQYGTSADTLFMLNDRQTAPLRPGQPVQLPQAFGTLAYHVQSGDSLAGIAERFGIAVDVLREVNGLRIDTLAAGATLRIPPRRTPPVREEDTLPPPDTSGSAARYPDTFAGRLTASGRSYDPERFTISHPNLPLGNLVLLVNPANDRSTFAQVTDRGPIEPSYLIDISEAVAQALGLEEGSRQAIQLWAVE